MNNDFNAREAQKARDFQLDMWNRENEYNKASSQRKRLEDAGYNPYMSDAQAGTATGMSNFLLALVLLFAGRLVYDYAPYSEANQRLLTFLLTTAILSLGLGLFNLIPIPPLDGSKVLFSLLPDRAYNTMLRYERYGMLLLWAVVLLGVGDRWMSAAIQWTYELFCRVVGF